MGRLSIGDMPISLGLQTCPIALEMLALISKQPTKLIVVLLDKVPKSGAL